MNLWLVAWRKNSREGGNTHRDRYLDGYESRKCTQSVQGGLLGGHKSTPVSRKHKLFPPACSSPLTIEALLAAGWAGTRERTDPNNTVCTVPQSVRYHKLSPPRELHVYYQPGQAKLRGGSNVYV
jgi:hypothetical protein